MLGVEVTAGVDGVLAGAGVDGAAAAGAAAGGATVELPIVVSNKNAHLER